MQFFLSIALLGLFYLPAGVQSAASPEVLGKNPVILDDQKIEVTPRGIHIQVKGVTLGEVLQQIDQISRVRFLFSHAMKKSLITAHLAAPDWPTAIRKLLRSFNTIEVWEKNENKLIRVFILSHGGAEDVSSERIPAVGHENGSRDHLNNPESPPTLPVPSLPPSPPALLRCGKRCVQWR